MLCLADLLVDHGDPAGARQAYAQVVMNHPEYAAIAAFRLGELLYQQGDLDGARRAFARAAESGQGEVAEKAAANMKILK